MDTNRVATIPGSLAVVPVAAYVLDRGGAVEALAALNVAIVVAAVAYLLGAGGPRADAA